MTRFASAPWPLKATYAALLTSVAAAAVATVTGLVALGGLGELKPGIDLAQAPAWLWYYRADPHVQRWLTAGAVASLSAAGMVALGITRGLKPPLHGAARWASEAETVRAGLRSKHGIVLGRAGGRLLIFGGSEHVMLHAPTRSGKGVGLVIPNLLTWPDSLVVLDVKRENWEASAGFRATHGQTVLLFDPLDPEGRTARFNPLGHIDRADPIAVLDELQKIAVMLFTPPQNADPFWAEAARTGFIGVGAYVAESEAIPFSLGAIYRELTQGEPRIRLPDAVRARAASGRPLSYGCVSAISDFCSASENTFASIKQTITSRMGLWLNPRVCAATDVSDFDLRDLRNQRISLYLGVSPDNLTRVAPLYNLLLQQLVDLNTRERPSPGKHQVQVLMVMDEFARLGHATVIAHGFSYVAGYGLRLLPVLQSPAQLRAEYGQDLAEEIVANCGVEVAFAPKELKVAQELSERLGYWTYATRSHSRPAGLSDGKRSTTESQQRRALMLPQEVMQMDPAQLLVLRAGLPPIRGRKIIYWRERAFTARVSAPPVVNPLFADSAEALRPSLAFVEPGSGDVGLPADGATEAEVEAWVERFIDASARPSPEMDHA